MTQWQYRQAYHDKNLAYTTALLDPTSTNDLLLALAYARKQAADRVVQLTGSNQQDRDTAATATTEALTRASYYDASLSYTTALLDPTSTNDALMALVPALLTAADQVVGLTGSNQQDRDNAATVAILAQMTDFSAAKAQALARGSYRDANVDYLYSVSAEDVDVLLARTIALEMTAQLVVDLDGSTASDAQNLHAASQLRSEQALSANVRATSLSIYRQAYQDAKVTYNDVRADAQSVYYTWFTWSIKMEAAARAVVALVTSDQSDRDNVTEAVAVRESL